MPTITKPRTMQVEVVFNELKDTEYRINFTGYYIPGEEATREDDASPSEFEVTKSEWVSGDPMNFMDDNHTNESISQLAIQTIENN